VCWEKCARYFEVEPRYVPLSPTRYVLGVDEAMQMVDENTIAVVGILGSTYTGEYEPIEQLNDALERLNRKTGYDVPIHVDAASGGVVAPFLSPDLKWDFRLPLVRSMNVSGHKYGLVYPGIGWVIWRSASALPEELIFHVNYLGGDMPTFNLNFSRPASGVLAQYYNFLRLGHQGYTTVMEALKINADYIREQLVATNQFDIVSDDHSLPLIAWTVKPEVEYTAFELSDKLRQRGWTVPAYTMPENAQHVTCLRVVVREGMSRDMAESLVRDMLWATEELEKKEPKLAAVKRVSAAGVC